MKRVPVSDLKAGMVLAKAIMNDSGMVLLSEGTALTDSLISRIGRMDIHGVFVEGAPQSGKSKEEMLRELDLRFSKTGKEPFMAGIKAVMRQRIEEVYG